MTAKLGFQRTCLVSVPLVAGGEINKYNISLNLSCTLVFRPAIYHNEINLSINYSISKLFPVSSWPYSNFLKVEKSKFGENGNVQICK